MIKIVSAYEARTNLGELINLVYYKGNEIIIERKGKAMVKIVKADAPTEDGFLKAAGSWKGDALKEIKRVYAARRDGSSKKQFLAKW